jgi:ribosomal protein S18 acetylase RimI-like enzyme
MESAPPRETTRIRDRLARGHANFIEAFRQFARSSPCGYIEEEPGVMRLASGIPHAGFNVVFLMSPARDPERVLADAVEFMKSREISNWRVVALPEAAASMAPVVRPGGLGPAHQMPGMLMSPIPAAPPPVPHGLEVVPADTPGRWATMLEVGAIGMDGSPWEKVDWILPFERDGPVRGYLGLLGGHPIATSIGFSHSGIGGVFFVATLPEFRGRGFGTCLTWRAVMDSRQDGCDASYLQASKDGYPVYFKMGYRDAAVYTTWRPEPEADRVG